MSIESILRRKGTDVATIAPEASIKSAADWLRAKNIGALVVTSENTRTVRLATIACCHINGDRDARLIA
jgi:predicted transcriptional regulator